MIFLLKYWKYLVALLVLGAMFYMGAHLQGGRDDAKAAVIAADQAKRDASAALAYAKVVQDRDAKEKAATEANRTIYETLEPKLAAATASRDDFARRLRDALAAESSSGPVSQTPDQPGATGPTGTHSDGPITAATADAFAECQRNKLRLGALQDEIRPQL